MQPAISYMASQAAAHTSLLLHYCCLCRFVFKDQYNELTTDIPRSASLYGLGETTLSTGLLLPRDGRTITLWNRCAR
jgi:hypothetical protein